MMNNQFTHYILPFSASHRLIMAKKLVKYCLVDTFTETAFKGNPSAVCLLEEEKDVVWLQNVAREFNQAATSFLTESKADDFASDDQSANGAAAAAAAANPKFHLRWFTRDGDEIPLCGHATLAASHFLLAHILPNCNTVELSSLSGILIARRIPEAPIPGSFSTELNFPVLPLVEYDVSEIPTVSKILFNGAPVLEIKTTLENYLFVVLPSGEAVKEVEPRFDAIRKYPARGIIITGPAPPESDFDFYLRFFCPNLGADEDHVCGSAHCALAPYWSQRLGKKDLVSYQASTRSGVINVHLDENNQRVLIRGKAVSVMEGFLLV